ncbi:amidohydrolase [Gaoshiqia sp. Z1-71]|uniref:amidohydrolase n=1 Tax=Gaoshiqia hydrogeniformans TaxID=3290090 RepID=UPI003BF89962
MTNDHLHISLIQTDLVWENPDANRGRLELLFQQMPIETDLAVLPEMFSTGFSMQVERFAELMAGETVNWMKELAFRYQLVMAGSLMISEAGRYYNRFVFVRPDKTVEFSDKRHLFSMGEEQLHFSPGTERKIFQLKNFRILPQVCYDLRFPVFSRNRNDYDLLLNCANWPAPRKEVWKCLLKARAIENQAYVAGVNRIGKDANGIRYSGDSLVFDPKGKAMVAEVSGREAILFAKLSKSMLEDFRIKFPVLPDADEFSLNL